MISGIEMSSLKKGILRWGNEQFLHQFSNFEYVRRFWWIEFIKMKEYLFPLLGRFW